jgi:hypothetical protein
MFLLDGDGKVNDDFVKLISPSSDTFIGELVSIFLI